MPLFAKNTMHVTLFTNAKTSDTLQFSWPAVLCYSAIVISAVVIAMELGFAQPLKR